MKSVADHHPRDDFEPSPSPYPFPSTGEEISETPSWRKGVRGMVERVFQQPDRAEVNRESKGFPLVK